MTTTAMGKKNKKKTNGVVNNTSGHGDSQPGPLHKNYVENKTKSKFTIDQLLDKAEEYIESFEFELAQRFCQRALEMDDSHLRALETSGTLLLELGEQDQARACFQQAVKLSPDVGHSKYMYLGQLSVAEEAVQFFRKGIELMETKLGQESASVVGGAAFAEPELQASDVSSAYCSIAEIYLTDLCMEEDAETHCQSCLEAATKADDSNPEAYQLWASFWLSKDEKQKAREMVEKGVSIWLPALLESSKPEGAELDPVQVCPVSYPARMSAAKLLIEVENYEVASEILELLLDEEDQVVEVWYLLGWLNYLQGNDYHGNARYYLQKAKEVISKTGFDDAAVINHMDEMVQEMGPGEEDEDGEEGTEENEESEDEMEVEEDMQH